MNFFCNFTLIIAAVHSAAIFLCAENGALVTYVHGKAEVIKKKEDNSSKIINLANSTRIETNDWICTGKGSRTQLQLGNFIYRLGSMSVVNLSASNDITLHSGSLLFCSSEKTHLVIRSIDSNATFKGCGTIIIETTENGGFKFIPIEGRGIITTSKGGSKEITGGRMMLIMSNPSYFGDAYDIDLMLMIKTSGLLNAFPDPLPSFGRISLAIYTQELKLKGKYNALIGDAPTKDNLQMWQFGPSENENNKGFFNKIFKKN